MRPAPISSWSMGSRASSAAMCQVVRRRCEGSSLGPSRCSRLAASAALRPVGSLAAASNGVEGRCVAIVQAQMRLAPTLTIRASKVVLKAKESRQWTRPTRRMAALPKETSPVCAEVPMTTDT